MPRGRGPRPYTGAVLDPDLVREVLRHALATGGRFAEVFAEDRTSTSIRLDDRKIDSRRRPDAVVRIR